LIKLRTTKKNGILVITDSLFSVDSTSPDLVKYQRITSDNQSYLLLNMGHDFGVLGPNGRGVFEEQQLKEQNNVFFVGSGSKSLGVNFAFIALPGTKRSFIQFWKYFCSTYMFTNAINPVQANCGLATLRMARSRLGGQLREKLLSNSSALREKFEQKGYKPLGRVSPIVCLRVGHEVLARMIVKALMENGTFLSMQESS
jgi:7-keto-8-aminopelargonate synthetase-like enzyme